MAFHVRKCTPLTTTYFSGILFYRDWASLNPQFPEFHVFAYKIPYFSSFLLNNLFFQKITDS